MDIWDLKGFLYNNEVDGMFNIPQNDSTNVWELNFEHHYFEIHPNKSFRIPDNCFILQMVDQISESNYSGINAMKVRIPLLLEFQDGDTLSMNHMFCIDTAAAWDIVLMSNSEEQAYFNKRKDAVWTDYLNHYYRHYEVKATIPGYHVLDSLRIYTFDDQTGNSLFIIGINFLKRFNVFFDMKNKQIGLQPIRDFQRVINPLGRRYHYSTMQTKDGRILVTKVADYESNYYKTAGLREGDEIVSVNGKPYKEITRDEKRDFYTKDTLFFDIVRNKQALKIIVPVNKEEQQGE